MASRTTGAGAERVVAGRAAEAWLVAGGWEATRVAMLARHGSRYATESKVTMLGLLVAGFVDPNVAAGSSGRATLMGDSDGGHAFFSTNRLQASAHRKSSIEMIEQLTHGIPSILYGAPVLRLSLSSHIYYL